jgi:hypothetical protein
MISSPSRMSEGRSKITAPTVATCCLGGVDVGSSSCRVRFVFTRSRCITCAWRVDVELDDIVVGDLAGFLREPAMRDDHSLNHAWLRSITSSMTILPLSAAGCLVSSDRKGLHFPPTHLSGSAPGSRRRRRVLEHDASGRFQREAVALSSQKPTAVTYWKYLSPTGHRSRSGGQSDPSIRYVYTPESV